MITLITGAPGAGKSAALVSLLLELSKDRTIYVNGIPDLLIDHQPLEDPSSWPDTVPDGSIVVIDEVQTVWRPRGPGQAIPPDIQKLETHRHRGLDFYIITQSPRLVHTNVRALVGRHVHLRDVGVLGRYWYEWPECSEQCAWRTAPIKRRYKLPKAVFGKYRSASLHVKPIRSFPWMLAVAIGALLATAGLAYYAYQIISRQIAPKHPAVPAASSGSPVASGSPGSGLSSSPPRPPTGNVHTAGPQIDDLILTGHVLSSDGTLLFQWVSPSGVPRYTFTRSQLKPLGIDVYVNGPCLATIFDAKGRSRKIACMPGVPFPVQQPDKVASPPMA